jgi:hypothetical protein
MLKIIVYILWVPVMLSLVGASIWWFQATSEFENPILALLWCALRGIPGLVGVTGLMCGPMLLVANEY